MEPAGLTLGVALAGVLVGVLVGWLVAPFVAMARHGTRDQQTQRALHDEARTEDPRSGPGSVEHEPEENR